MTKLEAENGHRRHPEGAKSDGISMRQMLSKRLRYHLQPQARTRTSRANKRNQGEGGREAKREQGREQNKRKRKQKGREDPHLTCQRLTWEHVRASSIITFQNFKRKPSEVSKRKMRPAAASITTAINS